MSYVGEISRCLNIPVLLSRLDIPLGKELNYILGSIHSRLIPRVERERERGAGVGGGGGRGKLKVLHIFRGNLGTIYGKRNLNVVGKRRTSRLGDFINFVYFKMVLEISSA